MPDGAQTGRSAAIRRKLGSLEAAAIAGIVCAVTWVIGLRGLLDGVVSPGASDAEITEAFADAPSGFGATGHLQLIFFGTVGFLWFIGVIRGRIGANEPPLFGTVFFGGSILVAVLLFVGAAAMAAPAVLQERWDIAPTPDGARMMGSFGSIVLGTFAPRAAALVLLSTGTLARVTRALPPWLIVVTYLAGVGQFVNVTIERRAVYLFPAWIAVVSVTLLIRRPPARPTAAQA